MIAVAALLQHLTRPEVTEIYLTSDAKPTALMGAAAEEIGDEALSPDDLLHVLFATGGSRYVDSLGPKPSQWRTRIEGVGAVVVSAAMNGTVIEARFALHSAQAAAAPPPQPAARPRPLSMQQAAPTHPTPPPARAVPIAPAVAAQPSAPPPAQGLKPRSVRPRDDVPSSRRPKPGRQGRPRTSFDDLPHTPRSPTDDAPARPSDMPTPPRGFEMPREAMPSNLELDLEVDIPSIPEGRKSINVEDGGFARRADLRSQPPVEDAGFARRGELRSQPPVDDGGFARRGALRSQPPVEEAGMVRRGADLRSQAPVESQRSRPPVARHVTPMPSAAVTDARGRTQRDPPLDDGGYARRSADLRPQTAIDDGGYARRSADLRPQTAIDDGGYARRSADLRPQTPVEGPPSGPMSPRTLPESGFGRAEELVDDGGSARRSAELRPQTPVEQAAPPGRSQGLRQTPSVRPSATAPDATYVPRTTTPGLAIPSPPAQSPPAVITTPRAAGPEGRATRPLEGEAHRGVFRKLLREAREIAASDLHLVGGRPPLVRVAGQLMARGEPLDAALVEELILSRVPRRLADVLDREGSCDFALDEGELGRFRVNASRQRTGIKASLRLVTPHIPTLPMLGLPDAIGAATRYHQGLIVLTGPMGHGKSTTLAALVDILNAESSRHIITVEDPIEHIHPRKRAMMSQREVGTHTRSFQTALKAALREDPDVIVVGELRDTETVRIALAASETGHLVLGTMSTPSAAKAIDRLIDLFPPADQQQVRMTLAGGLRLIVSQRLLPDAEGRAMVAAAEVLPGIIPLWNLIRDNRTYQIPSLQQRGRELGVIRLDDSLRELVRAGKVTAAAAVAVAEAPDEMEQALGIRRPSIVAAGAPARPPEGPAVSKGIFDRVFKKGG